MFSNSPSPDPRLAQYDHLIVHVTATNPTQDFDDHDIDRMHRNRGFNGCGYNALIKRDGTWLDSDMGAVTRPIGRTGAHVGNCGPGWNKRSFGVSMVGGVDMHNRADNNTTAEQKANLAKGIARFLELSPRGANGVKIMGHRDLIKITNAPPKACPCFDVIPWWQGFSAGGAAAGPDHDTDLGGESSLVDRPAYWTVASGDTLSRISEATGVSLAEMQAFNPEITNLDLIAVGQVIRLM